MHFVDVGPASSRDQPFNKKKQSRLEAAPTTLIEAISKKGFWFKIATGPSVKPEEYISISRI
jgi:hypothetical protein